MTHYYCKSKLLFANSSWLISANILCSNHRHGHSQPAQASWLPISRKDLATATLLMYTSLHSLQVLRKFTCFAGKTNSTFCFQVRNQLHLKYSNHLHMKIIAPSLPPISPFHSHTQHTTVAAYSHDRRERLALSISCRLFL